MKIEDHFKETLNRAIANEPPVLDAWDRFERRVGRGRQVRLFAAIAAAASVAVASVIFVPRLASDGGGIGLATEPPSPTPTPTATADAYAGWATYDYDPYMFTLRHPNDWRVVVFEADPEVLAPGQVATAAGEPTMAVTLTLLDEEFDSPELRRQGFDRSTRPDGRPFIWTEKELDNGGRRVDYRFDWSSCVPGVTKPDGCIRGGRTLVVAILAGTRELWDTYGETAERIVDSLVYDGAVGPYGHTECNLTPEEQKSAGCV